MTTTVQDSLLAGSARRRSRPRTSGTRSRVAARPTFMERIDQLAAKRGLQRRRRLPGAVAVERGAGARRARPRTSPTPSRRNSRPRRTGRGADASMAGGHHQRTSHRRRSPAARSSMPPTQAGVRVPTSCVAQGKCKECIVEVTRGMELLVAADRRTSGISQGAFRLSCQMPRRRRRRRKSTATRCAAARCASSGTRSNCRPAATAMPLDPAVDARRRPHPRSMSGESRGESTGPIHGTRDGPRARRPSSCG